MDIDITNKCITFGEGIHILNVPFSLLRKPRDVFNQEFTHFISQENDNNRPIYEKMGSRLQYGLNLSGINFNTVDEELDGEFQWALFLAGIRQELDNVAIQLTSGHQKALYGVNGWLWNGSFYELESSFTFDAPEQILVTPILKKWQEHLVQHTHTQQSIFWQELILLAPNQLNELVNTIDTLSQQTFEPINELTLWVQ